MQQSVPIVVSIDDAEARDGVARGVLRDGLERIAREAGADLYFAEDGRGHDPPAIDNASSLAIERHGSPVGCVRYPAAATEAVPHAAKTVADLLAYAVDRELAVGDLAEEMIASYEELNLLYNLLPNVTASVHAADIGEALVAETTRTLGCGRVSLLVLDGSRQHLSVLASRGLPPEVQDLVLPIQHSISERALSSNRSLIINDLSHHPDLAALSRGQYETGAFAVVRVPLQARGEPIGILTATERAEGTEFTARDQKLLEGLASVGASALLNCRMHSAINRQMISTIRALASAIDAKDQYTHAHSARVAQLSVATARRLDVSRGETLREIELAALLHDIGKIGISDAILSKAGGLTPEEFAVVKTHVDIGARIVEHVNGFGQIADAVRHHHERFDGLGYPAGLAGEDIPFTARLIAVADVFDCLTSDRSYRKGVSNAQALKELIRSRGTQLDPHIADVFVKMMREDEAMARAAEPVVAPVAAAAS